VHDAHERARRCIKLVVRDAAHPGQSSHANPPQAPRQRVNAGLLARDPQDILRHPGIYLDHWKPCRLGALSERDAAQGEPHHRWEQGREGAEASRSAVAIGLPHDAVYSAGAGGFGAAAAFRQAQRRIDGDQCWLPPRNSGRDLLIGAHDAQLAELASGVHHREARGVTRPAAQIDAEHNG